MKAEEELTQFFQRDPGRVKKHVAHLDMTGVTHAHFFVLRIVVASVLVRVHKSDRSAQNSTGEFFCKILSEVFLRSPVAPGAESDDLNAVILQLIPGRRIVLVGIFATIPIFLQLYAAIVVLLH